MADEEEQNPEQMQEEEQPPEEPKNILNLEQVRAGLSSIQKSHDGRTYAYVNLNVEEKELELLSEVLRAYQHLQHLNISKNQLKDISEVANLPYLMTLNASENQIADITFLGNEGTLPYLQILNLSKNKLTKLGRINSTQISRLILSENEIVETQQFELANKSSILYLDISKNKILNPYSLTGFDNLQELDISENEIVDPSQMEFENIRKINFSKNKITDFRQIVIYNACEHIMLQENQITDLQSLRQLKEYKRLMQLDLQENPVASEKGDDFKKEILILVADELSSMKLKKINDDEITEEDIKGAFDEIEERRRAAEQARLEAEGKQVDGEEGGAEGEGAAADDE